MLKHDQINSVNITTSEYHAITKEVLLAISFKYGSLK